MRHALLVVLLFVVSTGAQEVVESAEHAFRVELFAEGFGIPWGMAFLPDGRLLVTEREGSLRIVRRDGSVSAPVSGVPEVHARGQGGLMDVALHPDYARNRLV